MLTDFTTEYSQRSDDELLHLATQRQSFFSWLELLSAFGAMGVIAWAWINRSILLHQY
jgi:hypothetical protein